MQLSAQNAPEDARAALTRGPCRPHASPSPARSPPATRARRRARSSPGRRARPSSSASQSRSLRPAAISASSSRARRGRARRRPGSRRVRVRVAHAVVVRVVVAGEQRVEPHRCAPCAAGWSSPSPRAAAWRARARREARGRVRDERVAVHAAARADEHPAAARSRADCRRLVRASAARDLDRRRRALRAAAARCLGARRRDLWPRGGGRERERPAQPSSATANVAARAPPNATPCGPSSARANPARARARSRRAPGCGGVRHSAERAASVPDECACAVAGARRRRRARRARRERVLGDTAQLRERAPASRSGAVPRRRAVGGRGAVAVPAGRLAVSGGATWLRRQTPVASVARARARARARVKRTRRRRRHGHRPRRGLSERRLGAGGASCRDGLLEDRGLARRRARAVGAPIPRAHAAVPLSRTRRPSRAPRSASAWPRAQALARPSPTMRTCRGTRCSPPRADEDGSLNASAAVDALRHVADSCATTPCAAVGGLGDLSFIPERERDQADFDLEVQARARASARGRRDRRAPPATPGHTALKRSDAACERRRREREAQTGAPHWRRWPTSALLLLRESERSFIPDAASSMPERTRRRAPSRRRVPHAARARRRVDEDLAPNGGLARAREPCAWRGASPPAFCGRARAMTSPPGRSAADFAGSAAARGRASRREASRSPGAARVVASPRPPRAARRRAAARRRPRPRRRGRSVARSPPLAASRRWEPLSERARPRRGPHESARPAARSSQAQDYSSPSGSQRE